MKDLQNTGFTRSGRPQAHSTWAMATSKAEYCRAFTKTMCSHMVLLEQVNFSLRERSSMFNNSGVWCPTIHIFYTKSLKYIILPLLLCKLVTIVCCMMCQENIKMYTYLFISCCMFSLRMLWSLIIQNVYTARLIGLWRQRQNIVFFCCHKCSHWIDFQLHFPCHWIRIAQFSLRGPFTSECHFHGWATLLHDVLGSPFLK